MEPQARIQDFMQDSYSSEDLAQLDRFLREKNALTIEPIFNGLFSAVSSRSQISNTGYQDIWVRDNVMVASSFFFQGDYRTAVNTANGLTALLRAEEQRFQNIIDDPELKADVQERPHVRFNPQGQSEKWSHAQNDALGYALWLRFLLANSGKLPVNEGEYAFYGLFPAYFEAIEYWADADSGVWEEERKINSSSIGAVMAGLREMQTWLRTSFTRDDEFANVVENLIQKGAAQLKCYLPFESPPVRGADAAVLFLIHPADVLRPEQEDQVLEQVSSNLEKEIGIIRYAGDSYYGQDYPDWFSQDQLTADFSERIAERNRNLKAGFEARWCIFDPLLSVIYGKRFGANPSETRSLEAQTRYFNRSLSQLTEDVRCPELYFCRHGKWIPNPHTPLAWTQANLALALDYMRRSATLAE
jgi:phosphorylase kinase alpha/beta subunit